MTLEILFSTIDSAKNLGAYAIANLAFACLLEKSMELDDLKFLWETQDNENWELYNPDDNYYDIAVITDGLRSACIPAPLLRDDIAKGFMSRSEIVERREHNRKMSRVLDSEKYVEELYGNLIRAYPNAVLLAIKYLNSDDDGHVPDYLALGIEQAKATFKRETQQRLCAIAP